MEENSGNRSYDLSSQRGGDLNPRRNDQVKIVKLKGTRGSSMSGGLVDSGQV